MSFGKILKRIAGIALPVIGTAIGGPVGGAIGGAAGGAIGGGGLRSALLGGVSGLATGFAPQIGGAVNSALGTSINNSLLGGGIGGVATGALSGGGLRNALLGGVTGAGQGYLANGGLSSLGNTLGLTGENSIFGTAAGTPLEKGFGPTQGSGILGAATRGLSGLGSALSGGTGGGNSAYAGGSGGSIYSNLGSALLGGLNSMSANDNAEKSLITAQQKALSRFQPYVDARFDPGDLTKDSGYQFRLQEGEKAIGRQQAAKGGYFSGAALKAAQDYGQGLADTTYNEAYNRWLQQNAQNIGVAGATSGLDLEGGNARANAGIAKSNVLNRSLSSLLGGYGAYSNTGAPLGQEEWLYDPHTGQRLAA